MELRILQKKVIILMALIINFLLMDWSILRAASEHQQIGPSVIRVDIQVNSGLPNPGWDIHDSDDITKIQQLLKDLPEISDKELSSGSGYQGFILSSDHVSLTYVRVFDGIVEVVTDNTRYFRDIKNLQLFLKQEAQKQGLGQYFPNQLLPPSELHKGE